MHINNIRVECAIWNFVWDGASRVALEIVQKVFLEKNLMYHSDLLFEDFKVFSISQLYERTLVMYIKKVMIIIVVLPDPLLRIPIL